MIIKLRFTFDDKNTSMKYVFYLTPSGNINITVRFQEAGFDVKNGVILRVFNNEIIWREDDESFLKITPEVKNYINKMIKLKAFW
jgi:hypothetical protein